ncbi:MAG: hypothetical protein OEW60_00070 [Thiovulaceae bacterium]|nr:hypothetical protein [Sulfurimonadaceae bacterium]
MEGKNLAELLNSRIDLLVMRYESLKAENAMLREELSGAKNELHEAMIKLENLEDAQVGGIDEMEVEEIIRKLESAIDNG